MGSNSECGCLAFLEGVTDHLRPLKLTWLTERPVLVGQWPLPHEKAQALRGLVQEQLQLNHIVPTTSPWNTPGFVIEKKSGKWRLLHDLCVINAVIQDMEAVQPGMPSPTMLPKNWDIVVTDLKDCFFTISLHEADTPRFAFSVPSINQQAPMERYHWTVLPQGMKSSPTICQLYVALALSKVRQRFPQLICYHYMDDILLAGPEPQ